MTEDTVTMYRQLLQIQELDTRLDQLTHRRDGLPERDRIREADEVLATVDQRIDTQHQVVDERRRAQRRIEDELAVQERRAGQIDAKLYGGTVSAARELQDLQDELTTVRRHISGIEDSGLEALEALEEAQGALADLEAMRAEVTARREQAETALTAAAAEIDAEADELGAARDGAVVGVPEELLAEYGRLRGALGGIAVAKLVGNRCEGCHLNLSAVEMDRIRHLDPTEEVHCDECGRILVR